MDDDPPSYQKSLNSSGVIVTTAYLVLTSEKKIDINQILVLVCVFRNCDINEFKFNFKFYEDKRNLKTRPLHKLGKYM